MITIIWEFDVRPDSAEAFAETYGQAGQWAQLFSRHAGFAGTTLLAPVFGHRFFTIDRWRSEADFISMQRTSRADYDRIDALGSGWTESEQRLGVFPADRPFVMVSGLPGAGKSSLAKNLGESLGLRVIDKDDILERLFETKGIGDHAWRRALSRESDEIMKREALVSDGAILASFWHVAGMAPDSGTSADWVSGISDRVIHVHCVCPAEVAASRFAGRSRHSGHLDRIRPLESVIAEFRKLELSGPPSPAPRFQIDTSTPVDVGELAAGIRSALAP